MAELDTSPSEQIVSQSDYGMWYAQQQMQNQQAAMARAMGVDPEATPAADSVTNDTVVLTEASPLQHFNSSIMRAVTGLIPGEGDDDRAFKFAENLGATDIQMASLNNALAVSLWDMPPNPAPVSQALSDIVSTRTPDQLLTALEKTDPSTKPFIDGVREYPDVVDAIHNAVSKDPTVLGGLQTLVGQNSSTGGAEGLLEALEDDTNRQILVEVLNKTGDDANLDFADAAEYFDSAMAVNNDQSKENRDRYKSALAKFGAEDPRLAAGDVFDNLMAGFQENPWGTFMEILQNPVAFFNDIVLAMSGGTSQFAAGQVYSEIGGQFTGLFTQNTEMNDFIGHYGPQITQHVQDLTGQTDEQNGTQWTAENKPQTVEEAERLIERDVEKAREFENGNPDIANAVGSGLNTEGSETFKLGSASFNLESLGIRPSVTQAEVQNVADYDAQTEILRRQPAGMGFGTPSLVG